MIILCDSKKANEADFNITKDTYSTLLYIPIDGRLICRQTDTHVAHMTHIPGRMHCLPTQTVRALQQSTWTQTLYKCLCNYSEYFCKYFVCVWAVSNFTEFDSIYLSSKNEATNIKITHAIISTQWKKEYQKQRRALVSSTSVAFIVAVIFRLLCIYKN